MEEDDYRGMLESKRLFIVQNLQVQRTFVFDYLRHKGVLDSEDCELIHSEKTSSLKIGKFVDILGRKGPDAYNYLLESLQLENPSLYEKLTGKEASATASPIMIKLKDSYLGVGERLENGELEILSRHLERTYGDLHEMSRRFEQVVQRKKSVEERLETTISDLREHQEMVEHLKKQIDSERSPPTQSSPNWGKWLQYVDTLRKEKSDRDIYIIALQTKLMSTKEEVDELQKKNDNLHSKNEELRKNIEDISENFQKKKNESLRLSERIQRQGDEIKKAEQIQRKYRDLQFQNMKMREEKDHLQEELDELHKWTEALKTRFDIVEYEKEKTLTSHTEIIANYGSIQEELMRCREEMNEVQLVAADLRERVRHLEQDRQAYRKQRDSALTARREALYDRDKACLERDQALKKYNELKASSEAEIEKNILQLKTFDELVARNDVMEEEIRLIKIKMRQRERELEETKMKCGIEEAEKSDESGQSTTETVVPEIKVEEPNDPNQDENAAESAQQFSNNEQSLDGANLTATMVLLSSIKRRINGPLSDSPFYLRYEMEPDELLPPLSFTFPPANASFPDLLRETGIDRKKPSRQPVRGRPNSPGVLKSAKDFTFDRMWGMPRTEGTRKRLCPKRSMSDDCLSYLGNRKMEYETPPSERNGSEDNDVESTGNRTIINFL